MTRYLICYYHFTIPLLFRLAHPGTHRKNTAIFCAVGILTCHVKGTELVPLSLASFLLHPKIRLRLGVSRQLGTLWKYTRQLGL